MTLPNLYSEFRASRTGNRLLRQMYPGKAMRPASRTTALALATYGLGSAAIAGSPWVASWIRDKLRS